MKRFHNPMTKIMAAIILFLLIAVICLCIFIEDTPSAVYFIALCPIIILTLITAWGERKFRKADALIDKDYNTAADVADMIKGAPRTTMIMAIVITIAIIGGFVALFMYNAAIGLPLFILFLLILLIYPLYKSKKITTVPQYISTKKGKMRTLLQIIHDQILELDPNIMPMINDAYIFPMYVYIKDSKQLEMYNLISVQAIIGGKCVCIYPQNPKVFDAFNDKLKNYKTNGISEIFIQASDSLDISLIKDIVKFNIEQIVNYEINKNG